MFGYQAPSNDAQTITWDNGTPTFGLANQNNFNGLTYAGSNIPTSTPGFGGQPASNTVNLNTSEGNPGYSATYKTANGGTLNYDPYTNSFTNYTPGVPTSTEGQSLFASENPKYQGYQMFRTDAGSYTLPDGTSVNQNPSMGQAIGNYYLVNPKTGQISQATSHEAKPYDTGPGGFADWSNNYGWMIPAAMLAAGGAVAASGAGAAGAGGAIDSTAAALGGSGGGGAFIPAAGSGANFGIDAAAAYGAGTGAGTYLTPTQMGPTYGELGYTGVPEGGMGPTYAEMGYTGLNQNEAIAAADAAAKAATSTSLIDALKTANQIRQGVGTASSLAKLLGGGSGSALSSAVGNLAAGKTGSGMAIPGIIRGNQNPFLMTQNLPIQDTTQAKLASLLKQG
jgi:hypothetical protein